MRRILSLVIPLLVLGVSPAWATHQVFKVDPSLSTNVAQYKFYSCPSRPCTKGLSSPERTVQAGAALEIPVPHVPNWFAIATAIDSNGLESAPSDSAVGVETVAPLPPRFPRIEAAGGTGGGDTILPVVALTAPANNATISGAAVALTATCTDNSGVAGVQFFRRTVGGTTETNIGAEDTTSTYGVTLDSTALANAAIEIGARCRDIAGNFSLISFVTVTVNNAAADTTPPVATITAPATSATVSGTVTITATCTDTQSSIKSVNIWWDHDTNSVTLLSQLNPTTTTFTTSRVTTGDTNASHTIDMRCVDAADNTHDATQITVTVSNATGTTTFTFPPASPGINYPTDTIDTTYSAPSTTVNVTLGSNLQTVLDNATCNTKILLAVGTYTPTSTLIVRNKGCTSATPIYFMSANVASLPVHSETNPGDSSRVHPSDAANLAKILCPSPNPCFRFENSAGHYRFVGLEITSAVSTWSNVSAGQVDMIDLGQHPVTLAMPTSIPQMPHDITFDRMYLHQNGYENVKRTIAANGYRIAVINSYFYKLRSSAIENQCVHMWSGTTLKVMNNYMDCVGIPVMTGGASPAVANLVISDVDVYRNHIKKGLHSRMGDAAYDPAPNWPGPRTRSGALAGNGGDVWISKNLLEFKHCRRCRVVGNIFENNFNLQSDQPGHAILFTPLNDQLNANWIVVEHVTFAYNKIKNVPLLFQIYGSGSYGGVTQITNHLDIHDNEYTNVGKDAYEYLKLYSIIGPNQDVSIRNETVINLSTVTVSQACGYTNGAQTRFIFKNNILRCDGGWLGESVSADMAVWSTYYSGATVVCNVPVGSSPSRWPTTLGGGQVLINNAFPVGYANVGFTNYQGDGTGDYSLAASSGAKGYCAGFTDPGADYPTLNAAISGATDTYVAFLPNGYELFASTIAPSSSSLIGGGGYWSGVLTNPSTPGITVADLVVNHDPVRSYYSLLDLTNDSATWTPIAEYAANTYISWLEQLNGGASPYQAQGLWTNGPGLLLCWQRTADNTLKTRCHDAVEGLIGNASWLGTSFPTSFVPDLASCRDIAYALQTIYAWEDMGETYSGPNAKSKYVDQLILYHEQELALLEGATTLSGPDPPNQTHAYVRVFMAGICAEGLIEAAAHGEMTTQDAVDLIQPVYDLLLTCCFLESGLDTNQDVSGGRLQRNGMRYTDRDTSLGGLDNSGGTAITPHLNMYTMATLAWLYAQTGEEQYKRYADYLFHGLWWSVYWPHDGRPLGSVVGQWGQAIGNTGKNFYEGMKMLPRYLTDRQG